MKKIVSLSVAVCSLALATSAVHAAKPGVYLGLGQGYSTLQTPDSVDYNYSPTGAYDNDRNGRGGQLFVGYNFNEFFGAELNLSGYAAAKNKATNVFGNTGEVKYELAALSLVAKGYFPVSNSGLSLYALGGLAQVASRLSFDEAYYSSGSHWVGSETTKAIRPKFGAGVSYTIPDTNWSAGLEWSRIQGKGDLQNDINAIPNADVIGLTIAYNFG